MPDGIVFPRLIGGCMAGWADGLQSLVQLCSGIEQSQQLQAYMLSAVQSSLDVTVTLRHDNKSQAVLPRIIPGTTCSSYVSILGLA
jgi:hypothetical protein